MDTKELIIRTEKRIWSLEKELEIHEDRKENGLGEYPSRVIASSSFWCRYIGGLIQINEMLLSKMTNA